MTEKQGKQVLKAGKESSPGHTPPPQGQRPALQNPAGLRTRDTPTQEARHAPKKKPNPQKPNSSCSGKRRACVLNFASSLVRPTPQSMLLKSPLGGCATRRDDGRGGKLMGKLSVAASVRARWLSLWREPDGLRHRHGPTGQKPQRPATGPPASQRPSGGLLLRQGRWVASSPPPPCPPQRLAGPTAAHPAGGGGGGQDGADRRISGANPGGSRGGREPPTSGSTPLRRPPPAPPRGYSLLTGPPRFASPRLASLLLTAAAAALGRAGAAPPSRAPAAGEAGGAEATANRLPAAPRTRVATAPAPCPSPPPPFPQCIHSCLAVSYVAFFFSPPLKSGKKCSRL